MAKLTWTRFQWQSGEDAFSFETSDNGMYGTLTHVGGRTVTLPMVAWEGMLSCVELERRARNTRAPDLPQRSGARWSESESARVAEGLRSGRSISELAEQHARTPASIEAHLERLGLWNRLEHRPFANAIHAPNATALNDDAMAASRQRPSDCTVNDTTDTTREMDRTISATGWQRWPEGVHSAAAEGAER